MHVALQLVHTLQPCHAKQWNAVAWPCRSTKTRFLAAWQQANVEQRPLPYGVSRAVALAGPARAA